MKCAAWALAFTLLAVPARSAGPIFVFHADGFWLNLHHFLYVLGRAEAVMPDATRDAVAGAPADSIRGAEGLTAEEHHAWDEAVTFYANGPSRKDLVFDQPMATITRALAAAGERPQLLEVSEVDAPWRATLLRVAPIYRKTWWPAHRAANRARQAELEALTSRHGAAVLAFITRAYGMTWPAAGYPVNFSAWANWAGAYSTSGNLLVMSSLDRATAGYGGLEIAFHEGMHQWDRQMNELLFGEARRTGRRLPPNLSHALIFFTAGEAVRRLAPAGYVKYADANGVWDRGFQRFNAPLEQVWKPYLDGKGTRDQAIAALVAAVDMARQH